MHHDYYYYFLTQTQDKVIHPGCLKKLHKKIDYYYYYCY